LLFWFSLLTKLSELKTSFVFELPPIFAAKLFPSFQFFSLLIGSAGNKIPPNRVSSKRKLGNKNSKVFYSKTNS